MRVAGFGAMLGMFVETGAAMSDSDQQAHQGATIIPLAGFRQPERVVFNRSELQQILTVYGRKVASGDWRDYALDFGREAATFAIFRRSSEQPLFRVLKTPRNAAKQGAFSVVSSAGYVLRRGHDLGRVLMVLEKPAKAGI